MKDKLLLPTALLALLALWSAGCATLDKQPETSADSEAATAEQCVSHDVAVPQTNAEIRLWYNYQVVAISEINKRWVEEGLSAEERARRAYELRHDARVNARFMMPDKDEVKMLQERDSAKYGNPGGPTFAYLVEKNQKAGLEGGQVYEAIIESSSRTSAAYNQKFGVKKSGT